LKLIRANDNLQPLAITKITLVPVENYGQREYSRVMKAMESRLAEWRKRTEEIAEQLAGTDNLREQIAEVLHRWFISGKKY
jgi:hypothetical protein